MIIMMMMRRAEQKGLFILGLHGRETKKLRVQVTWRKKDDEPRGNQIKVSRMYIYDVKKNGALRASRRVLRLLMVCFTIHLLQT
jgi:hypothetical protein